MLRPKKGAPMPVKKAAPMPVKKAAPMPVKKAAPMPVKRAAPMPVKKAAPVVGLPGGPGGKTTYSDDRPVAGKMLKPAPTTGTIGTTGFKPGAGASFDPKMFSHGMPTSPPRMLSSGPSPTTNIGGSGGTSGQIAGIRPGASFGMKKGGKVNKMASGGTTKSASKRGDGIAQRGKTKGRMV